MNKPLFKSSERLVSEWPEVFEDLYINTLPLDYVNFVKLEFINGGQWVIDIKENSKNEFNNVEKLIINSFKEYESEISKLEITIDIVKLKNDISNNKYF